MKTMASAKQLFAPTHWSVVLAAAQEKSPASAAAFDRLCRTYWFPLYAYVRRRGCSPEDAQDLTQEFFARLLINHGLETVSPLKGKFRSFLLASINHLLSDEHDRATRKKRGGGQPTLSFDAMSAEHRYQAEPVDEMTAEKVFEHRWAVALVEQVLNRLDEEYSSAGKRRVFAALRHSLTGDSPGHDYSAIAHRLRMTEGAVRVAVHRLRRRFGALFRDIVAGTIDEAEDLEAEMRHLLAVLGG